MLPWISPSACISSIVILWYKEGGGGLLEGLFASGVSLTVGCRGISAIILFVAVPLPGINSWGGISTSCHTAIHTGINLRSQTQIYMYMLFLDYHINFLLDCSQIIHQNITVLHYLLISHFHYHHHHGGKLWDHHHVANFLTIF